MSHEAQIDMEHTVRFLIPCGEKLIGWDLVALQIRVLYDLGIVCLYVYERGHLLCGVE